MAHKLLFNTAIVPFLALSPPLRVISGFMQVYRFSMPFLIRLSLLRRPTPPGQDHSLGLTSSWSLPDLSDRLKTERQALQLCCHKSRMPRCHQKLREAGRGFSSREEGVWHCWHFDFCLLAFRTETESAAAALNHPVCVICYRQPLKMNIIYNNGTISIKIFRLYKQVMGFS